MEQVSFQNSRGLKLAGHFWKAHSKLAITLAHGYIGDKNAKGRFEPLAKALAQAGFNVLAFDFAGCGESEKDIIRFESEMDDLKSAITWLKSQGMEKFGLYGHSLGSYISLACYSSEVFAIVGSGALSGPIKFNWNEEYSPDQMKEIEEGKTIEIPNLINRETLLDFERIDQKAILSRIKCPVLLMHGDGDTQEKRLHSVSEKGIVFLPIESKLEVINGATHSFIKEWPEVIARTVTHFQSFSPLSK